MHPPALLPPTFSPDGENRTESEKEDVVDKLLDMYSSTGKQTVLTTLADVHEWAANTITELEADIVTRRLDYTEDCKRLDARIEELELRIADESRACALFQSHIRELEAQLTAAQERGVVLARGILAVQNLINESRGVDGYHRNGNIAEWDELLDDGCMLDEYSKALHLIHKTTTDSLRETSRTARTGCYGVAIYHRQKPTHTGARLTP